MKIYHLRLYQPVTDDAKILCEKVCELARKHGMKALHFYEYTIDDGCRTCSAVPTTPQQEKFLIDSGWVFKRTV